MSVSTGQRAMPTLSLRPIGAGRRSRIKAMSCALMFGLPSLGLYSGWGCEAGHRKSHLDNIGTSPENPTLLHAVSLTTRRSAHSPNCHLSLAQTSVTPSVTNILLTLHAPGWQSRFLTLRQEAVSDSNSSAEVSRKPF